MAISEALRQKLDQIELELAAAIAEFPDRIAVDRIKFARSLVQFAKAQLEIDDTTPSPTPSRQPKGTP